MKPDTAVKPTPVEAGKCPFCGQWKYPRNSGQHPTTCKCDAKAEQKPTHTPTPWEIRANEFHELDLRARDPRDSNFWHRITFWKERRHGAKRGEAVTFWGFDPTDEANAAFIVRAVNSFGLLMETAKQAVADMGDCSCSDHKCLFCLALEAIAQAEGKE